MFARARVKDAGPLGHSNARLSFEALKGLQKWIALRSITAESLSAAAGAERMAELMREAGFEKVAIVATDGQARRPRHARRGRRQDGGSLLQVGGQAVRASRSIREYCRSRRFVFSFVPRCQGLWGSQK